MADFSNIPIRENGTSILASWFNTIRTYLLSVLGHVKSQESRAFSNNGTGVLLSADPGNSHDGLVYDLNNVSSVHVRWEIERKTDAPAYKKATGEFWLQVRDGVWTLYDQDGDIIGDDVGVTFGIDISGTSNEIVTVKYDSTNLAGLEIISQIKYDAMVFKK